MATPVRGLGSRQQNGWILLRDVESEYADGGEQRVFEICAESTDLSSSSTEMIDRATNWPERYHLAPERANVIRPFELPEDAKVLEVGAGCGAVTRYLGETAGAVDALEPVPSRARANRERCRDLDNVEVFVGVLEDVPAAPAYDVVVVIGVLEYVAAGSSDAEPYQRFLSEIASRLKPGGSLILAIENKLGVKYLAGAPEDHSGRHYDSVEDYPKQGPARTFDRRELLELVSGARLEPSLQIAFPDYKLPRCIFRPDAVPESAASLLWRVPSFPSPDWSGERGGTVNEGRLWETLVRAGLASDFGNSFVVSATKPGVPTSSAIWPDAQVGAYFSQRRRSAYAVDTRIVSDRGALSMKRTALSADRPEDIWVEAPDHPFIEGPDFLDVFVDTNDERSRRLLAAWAALIDQLDEQQSLPLDLVPHNLIVQPDDTVALIDDEWRTSIDTRRSLLQRGCLVLLLEMCNRRQVRGEWSGAESVRQAVAAVGQVVGLDDDDWIDDCVRREAEFAAEVFYRQGEPTREELADVLNEQLLDLLDSPVSDASREPDSYLHLRDLSLYLESAHHELEARIAAIEADNQELRDALAERDHQFAERISIIHRSTSWRLTAPIRALGSAARVMKGKSRQAPATERATSVLDADKAQDQ